MKNQIRIIGIMSVFTMLFCFNSFAQTASPVKIAFDEKSERIDLVTGKQLPNYTKAQRGSFQFFLYKLDKPDDFFEFFHDGVRKATFEDLSSMEKVQPQFAIWRLIYKTGSKNTPRIHHLAISFIPLTEDGKTERRAYLLLNDLKLIDNGKN